MELSVHIVGPLKLQNELMASHLEREIGLTCVCCQHMGLRPINKCQRSLILWDCLGNEVDKLWTLLDVGSNSNHVQCLVALFNVSRAPRIEKEALSRGAKGIFLENDTLSIFIKGVRAILNGELWFSRKILTECLLDTRISARRSQNTQSAPLTRRESEVLAVMAAGATNDEIASELCISIHTVKTHIYNIYHKIDVPNRLQAALWASQNL